MAALSPATPIPTIFAAIVVVAVGSLSGGARWLISGAPILTYCLLLGASYGHRVLPYIGLWTLIATLNLIYAIAATSWLIYWIYAVCCYPMVFVVCLCQFDFCARHVRKRLRSLLRHSHFLSDKIAFFDLPAMEIDTDVDGLLVIRGITFHLSSLTVVAHGVEVGIKLAEDMELAMQAEEVVVALFRKIDIGDVYANIKGGRYEMSVGGPLPSTRGTDGSILHTDTPMLAAAASSQGEESHAGSRLTNGNAPRPAEDPAKLLGTLTRMPLDDAEAAEKYEETIRTIKRTNSIDVSRVKVDWFGGDDESAVKAKAKRTDLRAAICSNLHGKATIRHPRKRSIRVTTMQTFMPIAMRRFLHRMPLLYRMLLNPISYFHPVKISSITASASGKWIHNILNEKLLKHYEIIDTETSRLEKKISSWLADANFVVELADITGTAQVPIIPGFEIINHLAFKDVIAFRTLPAYTDLRQVVRLGGADATISVPSFLLPHHEHWLPSRPTKEDKHQHRKDVLETDGIPGTLQAERELEQILEDETNVNISAHLRLPACFDQQLLDFTAALVKATKVIEMERELSDDESSDDETHGHRSFKTFAKDLNSNIRDRMKKSAVDVMANDRWIAKMVGKITRKLESAQGDIGYSGDLPVPLEPYRQRAEEATKILS